MGNTRSGLLSLALLDALRASGAEIEAVPNPSSVRSPEPARETPRLSGRIMPHIGKKQIAKALRKSPPPNPPARCEGTDTTRGEIE